MRRRRERDASFWMGLVLGMFIGGAVALVLSPGTSEEDFSMLADKANEAVDKAQDKIEKGAEAAQDKAKEAQSNIKAAAESATESAN